MRRELLVLIVVVVALAGCPPPGQGPAARNGYSACGPAINALAAYHAEHGTYPGRLEDLVPRYLARVPTKAESRLESIRYEPKASEDYFLEFRYVGPGMNYCDYSPASAKWKCGGYY